MTDHANMSRNILIVEADAALRALMSELLSGYSLTFACNAFEAVRAVNAQTFNAYLLDYWLPDWSGVQLCRAIRDIDPHGPIIFCTRAVRDEDRQRALRAGANAYFCHPLDGPRLLRQLRVQLELSELESLRAKLEEERAIQEELERRLGNTLARVEAAKGLARASLERTARAKAYKAFIAAHGSRAHFESWWPNVFGSALASNGFPRVREQPPVSLRRS